MKKQIIRISCTGLLIFYMFQLPAQVVISTDTVSANNSAMLEVRSTSKGFLAPRLTEAQMNAVADPMNGLIVYCTTDNKLYAYIATENDWREFEYGQDSITLTGQYAPVTILPPIQATPGSTVAIPVKVTGFYKIGSLSLTLHYSSSVLIYSGYSNTSGFPGLSCNGPSPGTVTIGGFTPNTGVSLPDNSTLVTLNFIYSGGTSALTWFDNGSSCEYTGQAPLYTVLPDTPQSTFYINGSISPNSSP
jgi:hypothetical protein